jgi:cyclic beta-1,2-glucan synthetase
MAHHQGMSLLAACNLLTDGAIQKLFHSEPTICATELLLHEKLLPVNNPIDRAKNRSARGTATKLRQRSQQAKGTATELAR